MNEFVRRAVPSPEPLISEADYKKLRDICFAKCYGMSDADREDVFSDLCERAMRKLRREHGGSLPELINNNVFWKTGSACKSLRRHHERFSSLPDHQAASWGEADSRLDAVEIAVLLEDVLAGVAPHLVEVGCHRADQYTNDEIAGLRNTARGTVQYHVESFQKGAQRLLAQRGIESLTDAYHPSLPNAA